jgi:hypothetical protein
LITPPAEVAFFDARLAIFWGVLYARMSGASLLGLTIRQVLGEVRSYEKRAPPDEGVSRRRHREIAMRRC